MGQKGQVKAQLNNSAIIIRLVNKKTFPMRSFSQLLRQSCLLMARNIPNLKPAPINPIKPLQYVPHFTFSQCTKQSQNLLKSSHSGNGFYIEQLHVGCLAIYSYYIESNGEALIIDPQNDIAKYIELLKERNTKLKGVFLTHYHADYVAGHAQLQKAFGCPIYFGPKASESKGITVLKDYERITVGDVQLQCIHTPGHTEESSCLLLHDHSGKQSVLFTGDTVFLNEVGRPDLAVKSNLTAENLAEMLYDSLQKVKRIQDSVRIYPGHGSGSACGKSIGSGDFCDMGTQKKNNYGLKATDKKVFVDQVLKEMPTAPAYFAYNARLNKFDKFDYEEAFTKANTKLSVDEIISLRQQGIRIIDVRGLQELNGGIIKGAICIDFNGGFATWVGTLIDPKEQVILYGEENTVVEAIKRMLRIGYTNIRGYANFSIDQWKAKGQPAFNPEWAESLFDSGRTVVDVRKPQQWKNGIADTPDTITFELAELFNNSQKLDKSKKYVVHCRSGYRARIAYSLLKSHDFDVQACLIDAEKIPKLRKP